MDFFTALQLKLAQENMAVDPFVSTPIADEVVEELPHVKAGREAEEQFLSSMLKVNGVNRCALFPGLRVPAWSNYKDTSSTTKEGFELIPVPKSSYKSVARGEIDLVLVSQMGIFVLEIKNWSGTLSADGMRSSHWYQHRRNGSVVIHPNAVETNLKKATNLLLHLNREGCAVPSKAVLSRVVFVNPRVEVDPMILKSGQVILASDLANFIASFGRSPLKQAQDRWLPNWMTGCEISSALVEKAKHILRYTVGTWDVLTLKNGARLIGDFNDIVTHKQDAKIMEAFNAQGGRANIAKLVIHEMAVGPFTWIGKRLFGWGHTQHNIFVIPREAVLADPDKRLEEMIGHTFRAFVNDALSNVLPYKTAATVDADVKILFQCCGDKEAKELDIADVTEIVLSRI